MNNTDNFLSEDWQKLSKRISGLTPDKTLQDISSGNFRRQTALQRLAGRYRLFSIMALCCKP
ncbi:MAG: hypothetical protein K2F61_07105, partial [Muribaculaceae bacterium]|nr:hypothetical protein [Muribaculaceae bacterium]